MAYSYSTVGSKSAGDTIVVTFPFLDRGHVSVLVDGEAVDAAYWEWTNDSLITCLTGFPSGTTTKVMRTTPVSSLPSEQTSSGVFDYAGVNLNDLSALYISQERNDREEEVVGSIEEVSGLTASALASKVAAEAAKTAAEAAQAAAEMAETNAAASESTASAAATTATTQAGTATSMAGSASADADDAAAALAAFYDMFIGASATNPTVDLNGDAVSEGQLYWNTATQKMMVRASASWVEAYQPSTGFLAASNNLSDLSNVATARSNLGLEPGVDVQAQDAELSALAGLVSAANKVPYFTGSGTAALTSLTAAGRNIIAVNDEAAFKALMNLESGVDVQAYQAVQAQATWAAGVGTTESVVSPAKVAAAIAALAQGGAPWEQIGSTFNTTSGTSWSFTDINQGYSDLMAICDSVSGNSGVASFLFDVSADAGGSPSYSESPWKYTNAAAADYLTLATLGNAANTIDVMLIIHGYSDTNITLKPFTAFFWVSNSPAYTYGSHNGVIDMSVIKALKFYTSGGMTGDAGTFKLFGR